MFGVYIVPLVLSLIGVSFFINAVWKNGDIHNKDLLFIVCLLVCSFVPILNVVGALCLVIYFMSNGVDLLYHNKPFQKWLNQIAIPKKEKQ
jgi:hypothetical protein